MKKITLTLFLSISIFAIKAQVNKDAVLLGASSTLGYNSYSPVGGGSSAAIFNLNLKIGYFVANNFAMGTNISYLNVNESVGTSQNNSIGIFARYYFAKTIFIGGGLSTSTTKATVPGYGSQSVSANVYPFEFGFAGFITKNFAIEPSLNYVVGDDKKGGVNFNGVPLGAKSSFGLNIGFSYYFNRI